MTNYCTLIRCDFHSALLYVCNHYDLLGYINVSDICIEDKV
jgi:hypothetical protein